MLACFADLSTDRAPCSRKSYRISMSSSDEDELSNSESDYGANESEGHSDSSPSEAFDPDDNASGAGAARKVSRPRTKKEARADKSQTRLNLDMFRYKSSLEQKTPSDPSDHARGAFRSRTHLSSARFGGLADDEAKRRRSRRPVKLAPAKIKKRNQSGRKTGSESDSESSFHAGNSDDDASYGGESAPSDSDEEDGDDLSANDNDNGDGAPQRARRSRRACAQNRVNYAEVDDSDTPSEFLATSEEDEVDEEEDSEPAGPEPASSELQTRRSASPADANPFERILGRREDPAAGEMFYVKHKHKSYSSSTWEDGARIRSLFGLSRVRTFLRKEAAGVVGMAADGSYFDPQFAVVDRVIAKREPDEYLVKWCRLSYEDTTWETRASLGDQSIAVDAFEALVARESAMDAREAERADRKSLREYRPRRHENITESPDFGNGRQLREYQLEGRNWLCYNWHNCRNSILADEMGLGKTVQSVSLLRYLARKQGIRGPSLVVAPLSTIGHWSREVRDWSNLYGVVYHGSAKAREAIRRYEWDAATDTGDSAPPRRRFNVLVTTYEMVIQDSQFLQDIQWKCLIVDEAHRLKNEESRLYGELNQLSFDHCLLLTGTPIQNRSRELGAILHFLEPDFFPDIDAFEDEFGDMKSKRQVDRLQKLLKPYLLRRVKGDVEKSLPPRVETLVEVELTSMQKRWYRAVYEKNTDYLMGATGSRPSLNNVAMQLRKCCNHPYLLKGVEDDVVSRGTEADRSNPAFVMRSLVRSSGKMVLLDKLLPRLKQEGHRVLIFSQMVRVLDLLEDYVNYKGYGYERIDGGTKGSERQNAIDRYSGDDSKFVFLLCTRAGGVGINLTAADTVIIFDSDWNPQNDIQAQARCHRIGQTKSVQVYRLVTRNTYEHHMFSIASRKLGLDRAVLGPMSKAAGGAGADPSKMDRKEVENLLKHGAYHVFLNGDEKADEFCEEDIDSILAKRAKKVLYDQAGGGSGGADSAFSKASFVPTEGVQGGPNIDINDPDFWKKIGVKKRESAAPLGKRSRQRVKQYGMVSHEQLARRDADFVLTDSEAEDDGAAGAVVGEEAEDPKLFSVWSKAQRKAFIDGILQFGYGRWERIRGGDSDVLAGKSDDAMSTYGCAFVRLCLRCTKTASTIPRRSLFDHLRAESKRLGNADAKNASTAGKAGAAASDKSASNDKTTASMDSVELNLDERSPLPLDCDGQDQPVSTAFETEAPERTGTLPEWLEQVESDLTAVPVDASLTSAVFISRIAARCRKNLKHVTLLWELHRYALASCAKGDDGWVKISLDTSVKVKRSSRKPVATWWTRHEDTALLEGVYNLGMEPLGAYTQFKTHPKLCFSKRSWGQPQSSETDVKTDGTEPAAAGDVWPRAAALNGRLSSLLSSVALANKISEKRRAALESVGKKRKRSKKRSRGSGAVKKRAVNVDGDDDAFVFAPNGKYRIRGTGGKASSTQSVVSFKKGRIVRKSVGVSTPTRNTKARTPNASPTRKAKTAQPTNQKPARRSPRRGGPTTPSRKRKSTTPSRRPRGSAGGISKKKTKKGYAKITSFFAKSSLAKAPSAELDAATRSPPRPRSPPPPTMSAATRRRELNRSPISSLATQASIFATSAAKQPDEAIRVAK